jgi:hypothetical protein
MWSSNRSRIRAAGGIAVAAVLAISASACGKSAPAAPPVINQYLTDVAVLGANVASQDVVNQPLAAGSADGPAASVAQAATVVNGGSVQETVTSATPFTVVRVALEELATSTASPEPTTPPSLGTPAPARGYRQVTLSQATTSATLVLTIAQALPRDQFLLHFAVADAGGKQGSLASQAVQAIGVGTGDVQVSISWDVDSDVDLHVVDPAGDEVYYWNTEVASGGALDLDSNADCELDHKRNENITWTAAPPGTYTVRVDLYRSCGVAATNYVVTLHVVGQPTRTFPGTLTGDGDLGDAGSGQEVTTFQVAGAAPTS